MTDARLPERWLNDRRLLRLSDAEFRAYITSLLWSVSNRTDGHLESDDLDLIPGAREASGALVKAQLWTSTKGVLEVTDYASTQTSSDELAVLENVRRNNRAAQARKRASAKQDKEPEHKESDSQPDVRLTREPDRIGRQERQDRQGVREVPENEPQAVWPPVVPPGSGRRCGVCRALLDPAIPEDTHPTCDAVA